MPLPRAIAFIVAAAASAATSLPAAGQGADRQLGRPVEGITAHQKPDGTIVLRLAPTIAIEGGLELQQVEGMVYRVIEAETSPPAAVTLSGLDYLLSGKEHIGRRVKVTGGTVFGADASRAVLRLQGGAAHFRLASLPRDQVRQLVQNCSNLGVQDASCEFDVTGTVSAQRVGEAQALEDVVLERRQATRRRR